MEVCRLRDTPIMTFINKLDREGATRSSCSTRSNRCSASSARRSPGRSAWASASRAWSTWSPARCTCTSRGATSPARIRPSSRRWTRPAWPSASAPTCWPKCATSSNWCRAHRTVRSRGLPGRQAVAGVLRLGVNNFGVQRPLLDFFVEHGRRRRSPRDHHARWSKPPRAQAHRLRVQDPGQHGPDAPRPRRLHADLLGQVRGRHEGVPRAYRQGGEAGECADLHGQRPRDRRIRRSRAT
jgi:hypothetical protein